MPEYARFEKMVSGANQRAMELIPSVLPSIRIMGCTLVKMVSDKNVHDQSFDIVVVDEVSMVSVVYALTASTLVTKHLVLAGDPTAPAICVKASTLTRKVVLEGTVTTGSE